MSNNNYWDVYYTKTDLPVVPSQFASFCALEFKEFDQVVEFGFGNGRDLLFFSNFFNSVVGLDSSTTATNLSYLYRDNIKLLNSDVAEKDWINVLSGVDVLNKKTLFYARFFLHAIDDLCQDNVVNAISTLKVKVGSKFAIEFRTDKDAQLSKTTSAHYRRYINPMKFNTLMHDLGFVCDYYVEGFGYAKYKVDDAHVARFVYGFPD